MQTVKLNNCVQMPIIGYGVFMIDPSITERCVLDALSVGYRSLDTAQYYENEAAVGAAVRKSGIPRDQRFSKDKTPYKTHMGVYINKGGKKSGYSGYYFHLGAKSYGNMVAEGRHLCPHPLSL